MNEMKLNIIEKFVIEQNTKEMGEIIQNLHKTTQENIMLKNHLDMLAVNIRLLSGSLEDANRVIDMKDRKAYALEDENGKLQEQLAIFLNNGD